MIVEYRAGDDGTRDARDVRVTVLDEARVEVARVLARGALPGAYRLGPLTADADAGGVLVESLAARRRRDRVSVRWGAVVRRCVRASSSRRRRRAGSG